MGCDTKTVPLQAFSCFTEVFETRHCEDFFASHFSARSFISDWRDWSLLCIAMPGIRLRLAVAAVAAALPAANAILVAPDSPCSMNCGNVLDSTSPEDIACTDSSFSSGPGQIFQGCLECEMSSNYSTDGVTDVQASLCMVLRWVACVIPVLIRGKDNLRYTLSSCLFGVPSDDNILGNNPCITR